MSTAYVPVRNTALFTFYPYSPYGVLDILLSYLFERLLTVGTAAVFVFQFWLNNNKRIAKQVRSKSKICSVWITINL